jgi:two-component system response regulator VicR
MPKKILIVDDEPEFVKGLEIRLKHWGYDTCKAYNSDDCFKMIEKEKPDLILLDILMPKIDGITTCSRIKKDYDIPIIMVTVLKDSTTIHDASLFGAFEYITKPIDDNELKMKIEQALNYYQNKTKKQK